MGFTDFASKRLKIRSHVLRVIFAEFQGDHWNKNAILALFSGTFILALIGIGAGLRCSDLSPLGGAIAGGLGVCLGIFTAANVSGGHVNPAVTTAFWIQGRLGSNFISNTLMMLIYFAAQELVLFYYSISNTVLLKLLE